MNKSNDDFDNLYNIIHFKTKTFLDDRKPIQVNLNMQSTFHRCQKDNYRLNNYLKNYNFNDVIIINNEYINNSFNDKTEEKKKEEKKDSDLGNNYMKSHTCENSNKRTKKKYDINTVHLNINKNLHKVFQTTNNYNNYNNSFENNKNKKMNEENINKENIYINNTFNKIINYNNFNKSTFDAKSRKRIYCKNKINKKNSFTITGNKILKKQKKIKEVLLNKNEKEEEKKENKKEDTLSKNIIFKSENVEHFQIIPIKEQQKDDKNKNDFNKKENRNYKDNMNKDYRDYREKNPLVKSQDLTETIMCKKEKEKSNRNNKREKDNEFLVNTHQTSNSTNDLKIGETFKNSIRNRYKRERSHKKK